VKVFWRMRMMIFIDEFVKLFTTALDIILLSVFYK